jgi:pectate lyase
VINLDDAGRGSLRAAIEAEGPRTIVFRVGGTIELMTELVLQHPFVTIAGQTAPGGGITLKTHPSNSRSALTIARGCHDVILRHLRSRPGPHQISPRQTQPGEYSEVKDALQILGSRHVIVDHCSFSWATDEVVSTFYDSQDVTIQWCIISEALVNYRPNPDAPAKGLLIGSKGGGNISVHHNLMVHNVGRNPLIKCTGVVDVVNNVVLAPASVSMALDATLASPAAANFVGNHVTAPKADESQHGLAAIEQGTFAFYVHDNVGPKRRHASDPEEWFVNPRNHGRKWIVAQRHAAPAVTTHRAAEVLEPVLARAGCTKPQRDAVDLRIVDDVHKGLTRLVNNPAEVGGWPELARGSPPADTDRDGMPDDWERKHRFATNHAADGNADPDGDGYTNLEEFLNGTDPRRAD